MADVLADAAAQPRFHPVRADGIQEEIQVRGFSAFQTGLFTLPLAVMMVACAPWSGRLVGSHGPQPSLLAAYVQSRCSA